MQVHSDIIKVEAKGVISTFSPLTDLIYKRGVNQMVDKSVSKICSVDGCSNPTQNRRQCHSCIGKSKYANRKNQCQAPQCNQKSVGKLCSKHRSRVRLYGSVNGLPDGWGKGETPTERFWSRVNKNGQIHPYDSSLGYCWEWQGCLMDSEYGVVYFNGKNMLTHRVGWLLVHGTEAKQLNLHSCDNRKCVNADHLRDGTFKDNAHDMMERGRMPLGSQRPESLIDEDVARQVKILSKEGRLPRDISITLNISKNIIKGIRSGRTWKHVKT